MNRLSLITLAILLTGAAFGQDNAHVRFQQGAGDNAALQCAVSTYSHPDSEVEIVLYGVVHIADKTYFDRVQVDLDGYTTVLFEGVAPGKKQVEPDESLKSIGEMQGAMGEMLGLTFQKDGIDYKQGGNMVHADMNTDQLMEALGGQSMNPLGGIMDEGQMKAMAPMMKMFMQLGKQLTKNNPKMQNMLKMQFARQLGGGGGAQAQMMEGKFGKVILQDRNAVVMNVLDTQLQKQKKGTIAIFYGAAHMPDFIERLGKLGWGQTSKRWMNAWTIGEGVEETHEGTPRETPTPAPSSKGQPQPTTTGKARWF
ncbi:MAG: hypothetical protein R3F62_13350 [Planctomycetota bacterium]